MDEFYDDMDEAVTTEGIREMLAMPDFKTEHNKEKITRSWMFSVCQSMPSQGGCYCCMSDEGYKKFWADAAIRDYCDATGYEDAVTTEDAREILGLPNFKTDHGDAGIFKYSVRSGTDE